MVIGIDASRANVQERTGTEWYAFHIIQELKPIIPSSDTVVLYVQEPLHPDLLPLPANWKAVVLHWAPKILWTQLRLSIEMALHAPDVLYIPAHTMPLVHPKRSVLVVHDIGFVKSEHLYGASAIPNSRTFIQRCVNAAVRLCTLGRYSASEVDYHRFAMQQAIKHASDIITVSHFSKDEIQQAYPSLRPRISVIYNGRTQSEHSSDFAPLAERYRIHQPYILYIGRIEQKKNIPRLIDAFAQFHHAHPSFQLVLCGKPGHGYDDVMRTIQKNELAPFIRLTGWLNASDAASLRHQAHLMVLPSLYEGFGIPLVEAMDAHIPMLCSAIPALQEVAGDAALFCNPHHTEDIAQALEKASTNDALREQLRTSGKKRAQQFDWALAARQTWDILTHTS